uniref:Cytochrome P450 CYP304A1 n=1 Tax=Diaphorina citri TaxID=121845 RepID=A0A482LQZ1_DIACI|nr:cytochrome P450 CYP304A1 [Diaphorina citri]
MNPILFVVAMVLLIYFLSKTMFSRPKHFPPGPSLWFPYYGHFLSILFLHYHHTHKALAKMCRIYKSKILGFYLGPFPTVVASDEKSIRELLMKPQFQGRIDQVVSLVRVDFGEERGIIFTEGDLWQQQKRFFLRHLRDHGFGKRSEPLEVQLAAEIQDLITFLREERNHPAYQNGLALIPSIFAWGNIALLMSALTGEKFTGREGKDALNAIHWNALNFQFYTEPLAGTLTFVPFAKYLPPFFGYMKDITRLNDNLANYAKNSIRKKMDSFNEDTINCAVDAYIKMMKEAQADGDKETYFTEEQLKLVIQDFTFPASNTISGQLGFLWQQFLLHPEVQTKIQEELDRVVGRSELPNLNHRAELHYTEATIREIMRYKTLVPLSVPHKATEDANFMGYHVEKGTIMIPSLYCLHNDPDIWGDPENFRPERFLDSNGQLKKKDRTLPFGFGKRLCPGETFARQNMFMYVAGLLHNFTFSLPEGAKLPDDSKYIPGLNVHPQHFWMKVTPRS